MIVHSLLVLNLILTIPLSPGSFSTKTTDPCSFEALIQVPAWEINFTLVNTYEQETGPDEHRTHTTHELSASGSIRALTTESPNPDNVMWEGTEKIPVNIRRTSFTTITNPQGVKVEMEQITEGSEHSDGLIWFFINRPDHTYSFSIHDLAVHATTNSTERYLLPDGSLFMENNSEKTERFNLSGSVYDEELSGQCVLTGSEEQGIINNINFKRIEWKISPVQ